MVPLSELWEKTKLEEALKVLGLDKEQISVYNASVVLGRGTLGQISQLSGVNILKTASILKELEGSNLVVVFPGIIKRFVPMLPFLRSFSIMYDPSTIQLIADQFLKTSGNRVTELDKSFEKAMKAFNDVLNSKTDLQPSDKEFKIIQEVLENHFNQIQDKVKEQMEAFRDEFKAAIQAIVFRLRTSRETLQALTSSAQDFFQEIPPNLLETDVLYGESSVLLMIHDLVARAKNTLLIILAQPEFKTLRLLEDLPEKMRIRLIGNFDTLPSVGVKLLRELSDKGVTVRNLPNVGFWVVLRDSEELLIAPFVEQSQGPMSGLITTNNLLVSILTETVSSLSTKSQPWREGSD